MRARSIRHATVQGLLAGSLATLLFAHGYDARAQEPDLPLVTDFPPEEPPPPPPPRPLEPDRDVGATLAGATDTLYLVEAAGRAGYATAPIRGGVNPFGTGFGARAGVNLGHVYLGASVMDYLGGSDNGATDQAVLAGVEVGYDGRIGRYLTLRPLLGVGDTILSHTEPGIGGTVDVVSSASGSSSSSTSGGTPPVTTTVHQIYVQPGLTALFGYHRFFAAVNLGALVVPGITYGPAPAQEATWVSVSFDTQIGFRL